LLKIFLLGIKGLSIQIPYFDQTPKFEQLGTILIFNLRIYCCK
jgi:hypothetical protein